jgi:serine/threonine-protein kinase HipA
MTMTGNTEEILKNNPASYLDFVDIIENGHNVTQNLNQLWRRIIFNISISNTDDHLRNHGFILSINGWQLSPAYDINPSTEKEGLSLNIDENNNELDFELAKSVGSYFRLTSLEMDKIIDEVKTAVKTWKVEAKKIGIPRSEIELMASAFRV